MNHKKKGFTLVELLAVIIILIVIILLSVMVVKKYTLEAKKKSILANFITYIKASNTLVVNLKGTQDEIINGIYSVEQLNDLNLRINGKLPDGGNIFIINGSVKYACLTYDEYNVKYVDGNYSEPNEDPCYSGTGYAYTGQSSTFTASKKGIYLIELWGAQGGSYSTANGGKGAYTSGGIFLQQGETLYLYVGGQGSAVHYNTVVNGGYNGGGYAEGQDYGNRWWCSGGGATDVRLTNGDPDDIVSLASRIMVAAGGGGAFFDGGNYDGGAGGTLQGLNGSQWASNSYCYGEGGTQTSGGRITTNCNNASYYNNAVTGTFGIGGSCPDNCSGGGGGYYGGSRSGHVASAGGGSSFISGNEECDAIRLNSLRNDVINTGQPIHYSNKKFLFSTMKAGNEAMPTHNGQSTMIGNVGNGYARISFIAEIDLSDYDI